MRYDAIMKISVLLLALLISACSKGKESPTPEGTPTSGAPPKPTALAPKERMDETYSEIFQKGPMLPIPQMTEQFIAKIGAPKRVENGSRLWFVRDGAGACHEMTLEESGTFKSSKISDEARATAECGPAK